MRGVLLLTMAVGCKNPTPERLMDTGWFDVDTDPVCSEHIVDSVPDAGTTGWYWRDVPRVFTNDREFEGYDAWLVDPDGVRPRSTLVWDAEGPVFEVVPESPLEANTTYTLTVSDCEGLHEIPFTTSGLGAPIAGGPTTLQGRTFSLDLGDATWLEPGGVAPLLTLFFDAPVLIGVPLSNDDTLHLNLALGYETDGGEVLQDPVEPAVPFPLVDFGSQPYFEADVPTVDLDFSGVRIPVHEFAFSGTFSPDGNRIGGGTVSGIGDTRFAGPLLGSTDFDEVCVTAAGLGVQCGPCPTDGEPYCLPVSIVDVEGVFVPGLTLQAL